MDRPPEEIVKLSSEANSIISDFFYHNQCDQDDMVSIASGIFVNVISACANTVYQHQRSSYIATIMCAIEDGLLIAKKEYQERRLENEKKDKKD